MVDGAVTLRDNVGPLLLELDVLCCPGFDVMLKVGAVIKVIHGSLKCEAIMKMIIIIRRQITRDGRGWRRATLLTLFLLSFLFCFL